jgi:hypothetical protein
MKTDLFDPVDLSRVRTTALKTRRSKVALADMAKAPRKGASFREFERSLPGLLAAREFRALADAVAKAARARKTVLWMIGAHVVKAGLSPVLIELMRRRALTALAMNGAGAIHDYEMAACGRTSEDVAAGLATGMFGMAGETGVFLNRAARLGRDVGFGKALGSSIAVARLPHRNNSLLHEALRYGVPATVHVAIGTDIVHQQPTADGAAIGGASFTDFRRLCAVAGTLESGVVINLGSAVILPEVFLKALTVARNLGHRVRRFTAANLDMIQHYRPNVNVVRRPTALGGRGISLTGHHEIMVPLLAHSILERL